MKKSIENTKKVFDPRTIAILISVVVTVLGGCIGVSYFAGYSVRDMENREEDLKEMKQLIYEVKQTSREYVEQEVGGLRSDWERGQNQDEKRLEKLENK